MAARTRTSHATANHIRIQSVAQADSLQAPLWELVGQAPTTGEHAPAGASGDIRIERLILHHLDNRANSMELVDEIAQLDERSTLFFASHILAAARRADWFAHFCTPDCEVASLCRQLIVAEAFVATSQTLARRLFAQMRQHARITPGDFVAIVYTADGRPHQHIALLKLDLDQERLIRTFEHADGHTRVTITTAGNLLPETVKLQKCALLTAGQNGQDESGFAITLLDNQAGPHSEGVAQFFYRDFLMALLRPSARRYTRLFLAGSDAWMAGASADLSPSDILSFYRVRRAVLMGETVDVTAFASTALPNHPEMQDSLRKALINALFDARQPPIFPVDRAVADPIIQTVTLELDGRLTLKVDARLFASLVRVAEQRTGENAFHLEIDTLTMREVTR